MSGQRFKLRSDATIDQALNRQSTCATRSLVQNHRHAGSVFRSGRTIAAVLGFLFLFAILLILVSKLYLFPAFVAIQHADHKHRRLLAARSLLLMSVLLTILLVGLLASFRISRFFFPPPNRSRSKTRVVDAWAEAGKRLEEKPPDDAK